MSGHARVPAGAVLLLILIPASLGSLAPVPELGFALQCAGTGGLLGALFALTRRGSEQSRALEVAVPLGGLIGGCVGLAMVLVDLMLA